MNQQSQMTSPKSIKTEIEDLESLIGISFNSKDLLEIALTHRSSNRQVDGYAIHNERLEFLGDAVLELLISDYLFHKFKDQDEGYLTSIRSATVRTESLAYEAGRLNLGKFLIMSKGEESTGGRLRPYILANSFEALVGAIYIDQGIDKARDFLESNLFYKIKEIAEKRLDIDPKSKLQEMAQEELKITPYYVLIASTGPDHDKSFKMRTILGKVRCGIGEGPNKQFAEQQAADKTLQKWDLYKKKFLNN